MLKKNLITIAVFSVLLLLPFGVQVFTDLRGEKRFQPFDIFKDIVYTPLVRESKVAAAADSLKVKWHAAREAIAAGSETSEALEPVVSSLSDLESAVLTVNTYAELDTSEARYKNLKRADSLIAKLEDEPEVFPHVDSCLKSLVENLGRMSLWRAFLDVKHYGAWTNRYLRAFENKIDAESAIVLSLRPKYQLAVWNVFGDPGEKVVLGSDKDKWLYYRQDVEFLVQPSPLDMRSAKLDNPVAAIQRFRDQLKAKGIELLVVIVPGKPSIYPEHLTGCKSCEMATASHGKKILDSLTRLGFYTVDLYTPLLQAKSRDSVEGALYLNDDTHWTPRGAELAAEKIAEKVQKMMDAGIVDVRAKNPVQYFIRDSMADRTGDIGEMSGLNKFGVFKSQRVTGHVVFQQNIKERTEKLSGNVTCIADSTKNCKKGDESCYSAKSQLCERDTLIYDTTESVFKDDFRQSKILILGDSFSRIYQTDSPVNAGWIAHFAKNMNVKVASIVSDGGASTLVREKLARKASVLKGKKLLIWEFVERDLRFGAEGWKNVEF